jgi:hypothetical protein
VYRIYAADTNKENNNEKISITRSISNLNKQSKFSSEYFSTFCFHFPDQAKIRCNCVSYFSRGIRKLYPNNALLPSPFTGLISNAAHSVLFCLQPSSSPFWKKNQ